MKKHCDNFALSNNCAQVVSDWLLFVFGKQNEGNQFSRINNRKTKTILYALALIKGTKMNDNDDKQKKNQQTNNFRKILEHKSKNANQIATCWEAKKNIWRF